MHSLYKAIKDAAPIGYQLGFFLRTRQASVALLFIADAFSACFLKVFAIGFARTLVVNRLSRTP
ncbi:MAG TPA: hypothetical protein VEF04_04655 [Blastocatellia bacterium]|nr:hypothetical protein [Blastocatellia bacterium]